MYRLYRVSYLTKKKQLNLLYLAQFNKFDNKHGLNKNFLDYAARPRLQPIRPLVFKRLRAPIYVKKAPFLIK